MISKNNKKALSEIITTLLLIMLTVAIFSIIALFIIPYVKDNLGKGKACYDVLGKLEIVNEGTCFNRTTNETYINIKLGDADVKGILISLRGSGTSKNYEIIPGSVEGVKMFFDTNAAIELPGKNEERINIQCFYFCTYVLFSLCREFCRYKPGRF